MAEPSQFGDAGQAHDEKPPETASGGDSGPATPSPDGGAADGASAGPSAEAPEPGKQQEGQERVGHKYKRREPLPGGGYRYFYGDEGEGHDDTHWDEPEAKASFAKSGIDKMLPGLPLIDQQKLHARVFGDESLTPEQKTEALHALLDVPAEQTSEPTNEPKPNPSSANTMTNPGGTPAAEPGTGAAGTAQVPQVPTANDGGQSAIEALASGADTSFDFGGEPDTSFDFGDTPDESNAPDESDVPEEPDSGFDFGDAPVQPTAPDQEDAPFDFGEDDGWDTFDGAGDTATEDIDPQPTGAPVADKLANYIREAGYKNNVINKERWAQTLREIGFEVPAEYQDTGDLVELSKRAQKLLQWQEKAKQEGKDASWAEAQWREQDSKKPVDPQDKLAAMAEEAKVRYQEAIDKAAKKAAVPAAVEPDEETLTGNDSQARDPVMAAAAAQGVEARQLLHIASTNEVRRRLKDITSRDQEHMELSAKIGKLSDLLKEEPLNLKAANEKADLVRQRNTRRRELEQPLWKEVGDELLEAGWEPPLSDRTASIKAAAEGIRNAEAPGEGGSKAVQGMRESAKRWEQENKDRAAAYNAKVQEREQAKERGQQAPKQYYRTIEDVAADLKPGMGETLAEMALRAPEAVAAIQERTKAAFNKFKQAVSGGQQQPYGPSKAPVTHEDWNAWWDTETGSASPVVRAGAEPEGWEGIRAGWEQTQKDWGTRQTPVELEKAWDDILRDKQPSTDEEKQALWDEFGQQVQANSKAAGGQPPADVVQPTTERAARAQATAEARAVLNKLLFQDSADPSSPEVRAAASAWRQAQQQEEAQGQTPEQAPQAATAKQTPEQWAESVFNKDPEAQTVIPATPANTAPADTAPTLEQVAGDTTEPASEFAVYQDDSPAAPEFAIPPPPDATTAPTLEQVAGRKPAASAGAQTDYSSPEFKASVQRRQEQLAQEQAASSYQREDDAETPEDAPPAADPALTANTAPEQTTLESIAADAPPVEPGPDAAAQTEAPAEATLEQVAGDSKTETQTASKGVHDKAKVSADSHLVGEARVSGNAEISGNSTVRGNAHVSDNAVVSEQSYVGGNAQVRGNALVSGEARVSDDAQVVDKAKITSNSTVSENARVSGSAKVANWSSVSGNAHVFDKAQVVKEGHVRGDAQVYGNAKVHQFAWVQGSAQVGGKAEVRGSGATVSGNAFVHGNAVVHGELDPHQTIVAGNAEVAGDAKVTGGSRIDGDAVLLGGVWHNQKVSTGRWLAPGVPAPDEAAPTANTAPENAPPAGKTESKQLTLDDIAAGAGTGPDAQQTEATPPAAPATTAETEAPADGEEDMEAKWDEDGVYTEGYEVARDDRLLAYMAGPDKEKQQELKEKYSALTDKARKHSEEMAEKIAKFPPVTEKNHLEYLTLVANKQIADDVANYNHLGHYVIKDALEDEFDKKHPALYANGGKMEGTDWVEAFSPLVEKAKNSWLKDLNGPMRAFVEDGSVSRAGGQPTDTQGATPAPAPADEAPADLTVEQMAQGDKRVTSTWRESYGDKPPRKPTEADIKAWRGEAEHDAAQNAIADIVRRGDKDTPEYAAALRRYDQALKDWDGNTPNPLAFDEDEVDKLRRQLYEEQRGGAKGKPAAEPTEAEAAGEPPTKDAKLQAALKGLNVAPSRGSRYRQVTLPGEEILSADGKPLMQARFNEAGELEVRGAADRDYKKLKSDAAEKYLQDVKELQARVKDIPEHPAAENIKKAYQKLLLPSKAAGEAVTPEDLAEGLDGDTGRMMRAVGTLEAGEQKKALDRVVARLAAGQDTGLSENGVKDVGEYQDSVRKLKQHLQNIINKKGDASRKKLASDALVMRTFDNRDINIAADTLFWTATPDPRTGKDRGTTLDVQDKANDLILAFQAATIDRLFGKTTTERPAAGPVVAGTPPTVEDVENEAPSEDVPAAELTVEDLAQDAPEDDGDWDAVYDESKTPTEPADDSDWFAQEEDSGDEPAPEPQRVPAAPGAFDALLNDKTMSADEKWEAMQALAQQFVEAPAPGATTDESVQAAATNLTQQDNPNIPNSEEPLADMASVSQLHHEVDGATPEEAKQETVDTVGEKAADQGAAQVDELRAMAEKVEPEKPAAKPYASNSEMVERLQGLAEQQRAAAQAGAPAQTPADPLAALAASATPPTEEPAEGGQPADTQGATTAPAPAAEEAAGEAPVDPLKALADGAPAVPETPGVPEGEVPAKDPLAELAASAQPDSKYNSINEIMRDDSLTRAQKDEQVASFVRQREAGQLQTLRANTPATTKALAEGKPFAVVTNHKGLEEEEYFANLDDANNALRKHKAVGRRGQVYNVVAPEGVAPGAAPARSAAPKAAALDDDFSEVHTQLNEALKGASKEQADAILKEARKAGVSADIRTEASKKWRAEREAADIASIEDDNVRGVVEKTLAREDLHPAVAGAIRHLASDTATAEGLQNALKPLALTDAESKELDVPAIVAEKTKSGRLSKLAAGISRLSEKFGGFAKRVGKQALVALLSLGAATAGYAPDLNAATERADPLTTMAQEAEQSTVKAEQEPRAESNDEVQPAPETKNDAGSETGGALEALAQTLPVGAAAKHVMSAVMQQPLAHSTASKLPVPEKIATGSVAADNALKLVKKHEGKVSFDLKRSGDKNIPRDCSAFAAKAVGMQKMPDGRKGDGPYWKGRTVSTDSIYEDAKEHQERFTEVQPQDAQAGDVLLYPDYEAGGEQHQGHIMVVIDPKDMSVADMSESNGGMTYRPGRWGILAAHPNAIFARYKGKTKELPE